MPLPDGPVTLVVVDDEEAIRSSVRKYLVHEGYEVATAATGDEALGLLRRRKVTGMLLDVNLPGLSGIDLVPRVLELEPNLALIMLTAVNDATSAALCMQRGALDYLIKPIDLQVLGRAIQNALRRRDTMLEGQQINQWLKEEVALRVAERRLEQAAQERISVATLEALVNALEAKDPHLRGHSARVADLSASVAAQMGCSDEAVEAIRTGGRLHDIGKIGIREEILNKQGPLTDAEFEHVKQHVLVGLPDPRSAGPPQGRHRVRPEPSRALGRSRVSRPPGRRGHSPRRAYHRGGGDLRRPYNFPALPGKNAARDRGRADARPDRQHARSGGARGPRQRDRPPPGAGLPRRRPRLSAGSEYGEA